MPQDALKLTLGEYGPWGLFKCRAPLSALDTHLYMVGKTKKGKSKLLQHLAYQLITLGQGCALLDPHGDLADDLLAHLSPHLRGDLDSRILYFDPSRTDYLLPFNALRSPAEPYRIAQNILEAFRRAWPESLREAPRFANILLAATVVLIENGLTLAEMPRLLTDLGYRCTLLDKVADPEITRFFRARYDRWGREQVLIAESVLNKVGALTLNPRLRLILGQKENALPFRQLMDEGRVLICNLGRVDAETRRLLGSLIVTGFEQAALSRQDIAPQARRRFHLIVDEYQSFATESFPTLQSESRKFNIDTLVAHQYRNQLDEMNRGSTLNVGNLIIFRTTGVDGQELALQFDNTPPAPEMERQSVIYPTSREGIYRTGERGEYVLVAGKARLYSDVQAERANKLVNLPPFTAYCKLAGDRERTEHLMRTPPVQRIADARLAERIRQRSRQMAMPRAEVERLIEQRVGWKAPQMAFYEELPEKQS